MCNNKTINITPIIEPQKNNTVAIIYKNINEEKVKSLDNKINVIQIKSNNMIETQKIEKITLFS